MQESKLWHRLSLVIITCAFGVFFAHSSFGESLDRRWYDFLFNIREQSAVPENVVIVAIDEDSFDELDLQWPWPRSLHGNLIEALSRAGAKTIVFDILFAEPSSEGEDLALAEAISKNDKVILANEISKIEDTNLAYAIEKIIDPSPIVELANKAIPLGYSNVQLDDDGFVRKLLTEQSDEQALSLVAAEHFSGQVFKNLPNPLLINYLGAARTIKTISYYQALEPEQSLPANFLKDSLVFVGFSALAEAELKSTKTDHFPVPFTSWRGGYMPGVEIHANAAWSILSNSYIRLFDERKLFVFSILLALSAGLVFFQFRPLVGIFLYCALLLAFASTSYLIFIDKNLFLPLPFFISPLSLCFLVSPFFHYFWIRKQRTYIRGAFETYLSPKLVNELLKSKDRLELGGEEREGTVLFLDLVGFTSISEKVSPKELIALINRNLGGLAEIILKHDGMIDKYIGDAIMAVWGVPLDDAKHADKACRAALEIISGLESMNAKEKEISGADLSLRIGISSGTILAGNVGGGKRLNYTVLGNTVNLASRLEGLNKDFGTKVIISEDTVNKLSAGFETRSLACVKVKGQEREVCIYELCEDG